MAVAPVMAPEERSNSPPIMSSETATAMMPELGRHVEVVGGAGRGAEDVGRGPEEEPDRGGPDEGADLGADQQPLDRPPVDEPLVRPRRRAPPDAGWVRPARSSLCFSHVDPQESRGAGGQRPLPPARQ